MKKEKKAEWKGAIKVIFIVAVLCVGIGIAVAAWDDTKTTGDTLTAAEWNAMSIHQKNAIQKDGSISMSSDLDISNNDIVNVNALNMSYLSLNEKDANTLRVSTNYNSSLLRDLQIRYAYADTYSIGFGGDPSFLVQDELYFNNADHEWRYSIKRSGSLLQIMRNPDSGDDVFVEWDSGGAVSFKNHTIADVDMFVPGAPGSGSIGLTGYQWGSAAITTLITNNLTEENTGTGITIDGCLIKDGYPYIPNHTPSSASEACTAGQLCYDSSYTYVCIATNTWERTALSSW